jgi:NADH:ubiquinone oxidoreductase subunit
MDTRSLEKKSTKDLRRYRRIQRSKQIHQRKYGVKYYNITDISRRGLAEADLVASDGLHPSEKMYSEWVNVIHSDINVVPKKEER